MRLRHRTSVVLLALCAACLCGGAVAAAQAVVEAAAPTDPREASLLASLAGWSGWPPQRLHDLRAAGGEDDAEEFAVAVVVALTLGVSARALVEDGMRYGIVVTLRRMGISSDTARRELRRAEQQVRRWRRQPPPTTPAAVPVSVPPGG